MAVTTEELRAIITADPSGFVNALTQVRAEMAQNEAVSLRSTRNYTQGVEEATKATAGLAGGIGTLGAIMGVTFAVGKIAGFAREVVALSSTYTESQRQIEASLGDSAKSVEAWAEANAEAFGMSRVAAANALGNFSALFDSMGLGDELAGQMSKAMVQLGGDIAAFANVDPSVALKKLQMGLSGEGEALRELGIAFTGAEVKQKAFELGLITQGEELDASSKAQAAFAIILEKSKAAQGAAAAASTGLAGELRTTRAMTEDAALAIGQMLEPAATSAARTFNDVLGGALVLAEVGLGNLLGATSDYSTQSVAILDAAAGVAVDIETNKQAVLQQNDIAFISNMLANNDTYQRAKVAGDAEAQRVIIGNTALGVAAIETLTNEHFSQSLINATLYQETLSNYIFRKGWENIVNSVGESWTAADRIVSEGYAATIEGGVKMVESVVKAIGGMFPTLFQQLKDFVGALPAPIQAIIGGFGTLVRGAIDAATAPFRLAITGALAAADLLRKGAGAVWSAFQLTGEVFQGVTEAEFGRSAGAVSYNPQDYKFQPGGVPPAPKAAKKPKAPTTPRDSGGGKKSKEEDAALVAARIAEAVAGAIEAGLDALRSLAKEPLPPEEQWRARLDALTVFLDASNQAFEGLLVDQFARYGVKLAEGAKAFVKGPMSALEPFADAVEAGASALQTAAEAGGKINDSEAVLADKLAQAERNTSMMVDSLYRLSANFRSADATAREELLSAVGDFDTYLTTAASVLSTAASIDLRGATDLQARNVATAEANSKVLQDSLYRASVNFRAASEVAREVLLGASQDYVTYLGLSRQAMETAAGIDLTAEITLTRQRADAAAAAAGLLVNATYAAAHNFIVAASDDRRGLAALLGGVDAWNTVVKQSAEGLKTSATLELPRQVASTVVQIRAAANASGDLVDATWDAAQNFIIAATDNAKGLAALVDGVNAWSAMLDAGAAGLERTVDAGKLTQEYTAMNVDNLRAIASDAAVLLDVVQIGSAAWRMVDEKMRTGLVQSLNDFADANAAAADVITSTADVLKIANVPNVLRRDVVDTWHVLAAYAVLLLGEVERASAAWRAAADEARNETAEGLQDFADAEAEAVSIVSDMADVLKLGNVENVLRRDVLDSWKVLADYAPLLLAEVERATAEWRKTADKVRDETSAGLQDFADASSAAADIVGGMADALDAPTIENVLRRDVLDSWHVLAAYAALLLPEVEKATAEWRKAASAVRTEAAASLQDFADAEGAAVDVVTNIADLLTLADVENVLKRSVVDTWHVLAAYAVLLVGEVERASVAWRSAAQDVRTEGVDSLQDFADATGSAASVVKDMADVLGIVNVENVLRRSVLDTWHILAVYGSLMAQEVQKVADLAPEFNQKGLDAFADAVGAASSALADAADALEVGSKLQVADPAAVVARMKEAALLFLGAGKDLADVVRADDAQIRASIAESVGKIATGFGDLLGLIDQAIESPFAKVRATGQRGDTFRENIRRRIVSSLQLAVSALTEATASLKDVPTVDAAVLTNINSIAAAYSAIMGLVTEAQKALASGGSLEAVRRLSQVPFILAEGLAVGGNLAGSADAKPQNGGLAVNVNLSPTFLPINITTNVSTTVQVGPVEMGRFYDVYEEYRRERLEGESGR